MTFLPDINVLIALIDPMHIHHDPAHDWFAVQAHESWATCPTTENGVLRIVGNPAYSNSPGTPSAVATLMTNFCALPGHVFWPDDVSLLDPGKFQTSRLLASAQTVDTYLLGLARAHGGQLATFDRHLITDATHNGARFLHLIP
ncbi:hypothetical protein HNQ77_000072 [Silvibacterium bohemicum]|uniref:Ribonuclease VapC n=1 Tax=Silvibacterium bohemicum TaxID=1577686 RepID=A0A841JVX9_9BACT|nr:TA system VapC family ribonuclease toxin [Silvibacterium bohemicum]MBB6142134.1 hypothetical protein [Silvibacterium bohemicum]